MSARVQHGAGRLRRVLGAAGAAALVACAGAVVAGHAEGLRLVPVLSGSMAPAVPRGALVLTRSVAPADVRVGDVVGFALPPPYRSGGHPVLHRVHALSSVHGAATMTTRGDHNPGPDPWTIALAGADLGRAEAAVPVLGWALMGGPRALFLLLVGAVLVHEALRGLRRHDGAACTCAPGTADAEPAPPAQQEPCGADLRDGPTGRGPVRIPRPRAPATAPSTGRGADARAHR